MFQEAFGCPKPKEWQLEAVESMLQEEPQVVLLSRPTGDGKTLAMMGGILVNGGVTLVIAATILLGSHWFGELQENEHFHVIFLENVKSEKDIEKLKKDLNNLSDDDDYNIVLVISPRTLAMNGKKGWCPFLLRLALTGKILAVLLDEGHLVPQHGLTFRYEEYRIIYLLLFGPMMKSPLRPHIMVASATMPPTLVTQLKNMWDLEVTKEICAPPEEMGCRNVNIFLAIRSSKDITITIKKEIKALEGVGRQKFFWGASRRSRLDTIEDRVYEAVDGTKMEDIFVARVDGETSSRQKQAAIRLYTGQIEDPLQTDALAYTTSTGAEAFNCHDITCGFQEGLGTSIEQERQLVGRLRCSKQGQNYKFHRYFNVADYCGTRIKILRNKRGQKMALAAQHETLVFNLTRACMHKRYQVRFGRGDPDRVPNHCDGKCPHCRGDLIKEFVRVDRKELTKHLQSLFNVRVRGGKPCIPLDEEFAQKLCPKNDVICQKLYRKKETSIKRHLIDALVLQLVAYRLVEVFDEKKNGTWEIHVCAAHPNRVASNEPWKNIHCF